MPAFIDICAQLQATIESSGFHPDVLIPVPRGGNRVANRLFTDIPRKPVTLIRPSKGKLKRSVASCLLLLPSCMRDALRIAEAKILVRKRCHMDNTIIELPELSSGEKILIVDDAVDSGATLKAIVEEFAKRYPDRDIRTAVITITGTETTYRPDFYVLDNRTLIRTPWSIDMPKSKRFR